MNVPTLEDAIILTAQYHHGQKDKQGRSYILHVLNVLDLMSDADENYQIVAVLHDIVEDTSMTISGLSERGYGFDIVSAVRAISREPFEPYEEYIVRCSRNKLACRVKIADLLKNVSSLESLNQVDQKRLLAKYKAAFPVLLEAAMSTEKEQE
jgi:(p)ppGpp synthase/HD superfamily hydrolase